MRKYHKIKSNTLAVIACLLSVTYTGVVTVSAAKKGTPAAPLASLSATGNALEKKYADMLKASLEDIGKSLPKIEEAKKSAFMKAHETETAAAVAVDKALKAGLNKNAKDKSKLSKNLKSAQEALAKATQDAAAPVKAMLAAVEPFLASNKADAHLMRGTILTHATPQGLAEYAQEGKEQEAMIDKLLSDVVLMQQILEAGGAEDGKYAQALQIYSAIQKVSPKAKDGLFQRLALATSLEHAVPITQTNAEDQTSAPTIVDPVKRYLHYEKAYLDGELDAAFKDLTVWEYRMVINCDAPDEILAWGREMLRNYRPDHVYNPNHGWRYSAAVKTEVPYGSQNEKYDLPSLHKYQNIPKDGGVCGRRAFFGRFILRSFGIPVWGVTQHAHAALSHWTPKGWLINLGAGFQWSWWDKDEAPRSGLDFLLETQARVNAQDYFKVLRSQWVSDVLGEQDYNDRKGVAGGFWSAVAHQESVVLAAKEEALGPLGQELAEANESKDKEKVEQVKLADTDKKIVVGQNGVITIPAVAASKPSGRSASMKSFSGGFQIHSTGGFKAEYALEAPRAGKYALAARVVTLQEGQKFLISANDEKTPVEIAVPYTIGKWQSTQPVEVSLASGKNVIHFSLKDGSRGVSIKEFTLTPVK